MTEPKDYSEQLALFNFLEDAAIAVDFDNRIVFWNQAAERIYGYSSSEVLGRPIDTLIEIEAPIGREELRKVLQTRGSWNGEVLHKSRSGKRLWVDWSLKILEDPDEGIRCLFGTARDITRRKGLEEERTKLEGQLLQSQKMEAIGRLAGGVAHDFNNILTGITGYTELVQSTLDPEDPMYADMEEIRKASERAADLTNQLLAFSRKQLIDPKVIEANEILSHSNKMLERIIGEDIDLVFLPGKDLWRIMADPTQIDQILVNLAVNARDALPDGGKLTIETANVTLEDISGIEAEVGLSGEFVMIGISDNGLGMEKEMLNHIFEPFFSTKTKDKGTGLGLATVYGIVRQHKGFIKVYSERGTGTTFKIYFPAVKEKAVRLPGQEPSPIPRGDETVLLVEDDEIARSAARKILENYGYEVVEAEDGEQALLRAGELVRGFDLLVTDVIMPVINGKELYEKLRETRPGLKALFMSGYTDNVIAHHGVLDEGTLFIQKPFSIDAFIRKVRNAIDS